MYTKISILLPTYMLVALATVTPSISFVFINNTCSSFDEASTDICKMERKCTKGDFMIAIMANIHLEKSDTFWCSDLLERTVEQVAAIQWIFDKLNTNNYISGVNIGNTPTNILIYFGIEIA